MYDASDPTLTDQVAVPLSSAEVTVSVSVPITTVTLTPLSVPVSPLILNPAAFSATLMTSSVAIRSTFSTSAPMACTVTGNLTVASL